METVAKKPRATRAKKAPEAPIAPAKAMSKNDARRALYELAQNFENKPKAIELASEVIKADKYSEALVTLIFSEPDVAPRSKEEVCVLCAELEDEQAIALILKEIECTVEVAEIFLTHIRGIEYLKQEEDDAKALGYREQANTLLAEFNELNQEGESTKAMAKRRELEDCINEYTAIKKVQHLRVCCATAHPMTAGIVGLKYETIKVRDKMDADTKIATAVIEPKRVYVDLVKLSELAKDRQPDQNWVHTVQNFNCLMTARTAILMENHERKRSRVSRRSNEVILREVNDSYAMSDIAKKLSVGEKVVDPSSLLKALQACITSILGEGYRATTVDLHYLEEIYSKKSSRADLKLSCSNHNTMRQHIADICHSIIMREDYGVEYKAIKA